MTKRKLTCIVCPVGCEIDVTLEEGKVVAVEGNTCSRGKIYAETECINPQRTVTSTVSCENGKVVAVKTDKTIPKDKVEECMKIINKQNVHLPVSIGDVIIKDVFGSNIIATQNMK